MKKIEDIKTPTNLEEFRQSFKKNCKSIKMKLLIDNYESKDIYTLGGYGWYEQKNTLQLYNFQNTRWDPLQYQTNKGKLYFPRCKANVKYDKALDKYFIYGGQGNESGKQQQGFRELNDFWILDMNILEFNQIWGDSSQAYEDGDKYQKVAISGKHKTIFKISP